MIQSHKGVGGATFLHGRETLKSVFCAGEERGFYCCVCDQKRGGVLQVWHHDFNFGLALHLMHIEMKMIPA